MGFEADIPQHDEIVIAMDILEGARQHLDRVLLIAREEFGVGFHHALGRITQALAVRIVAGIADQRADGGLGLLPAGTVLAIIIGGEPDSASGSCAISNCIHMRSIALPGHSSTVSAGHDPDRLSRCRPFPTLKKANIERPRVIAVI
jgi:hypothetical protein